MKRLHTLTASCAAQIRRTFRAFREGLKELSFVEGHNVEIEYRYADSKYDRLAELANELVHRSVSVLFASGNASALAAKRATSTIPVVFAVGNDPVEMGLVNSLSRPNGNVTGVSFFTTSGSAKRLEFNARADITISYYCLSPRHQ